MNKVILMGRIGKDPELKTLQNETKIVNFSLATDEGKDRNGESKTTWHNCIAFNKQAEFIDTYLGKGKRCLVEGSLQRRSWEKDGKKGVNFEVIVNRLEVIDWSERMSSNYAKKDDKPFNQGENDLPY